MQASTDSNFQNGATELTDFRDCIRQLYDMKERAFADADPAPIVDRFYAADAVSVGEGFGIHAGRSGFQEAYRDFVRMYNVRIESVHSRVSGNLGIDWTNFYVIPKGEIALTETEFCLVMLFTWEKVDGRWVCKGEVFARAAIRSNLFGT